MTGSVRRRNSKWDLKEDPDHFPTENIQDSGWSAKGGEFIHDKEPKSEWKASKGLSSHGLKWSNVEARSVPRNEGNSKWSSSLEPSPLNRGIQNYEFDKRDCNDMSRTIAVDGDRSYSMCMSPGLDGWRQFNRSRSPKTGWSRSHRSRSRSRSRTRSPPYGFRRDLEESNNGGRSGSRVCSEFAKGRCTRGSHCRFLHLDNHDSDSRVYLGSSHENGGSKHEKGGSVRNPSTEEQMNYSRDKFLLGYDNVYDGNLEKREFPVNNTSSSRPCLDFLKGHCRKGSCCRYPHHGAPSDGHGVGERNNDRKDPNSSYGHEIKRELRRICKFFAAGHCRNGDNCKFSHEGTTRCSPEVRTSDDRRVHDLGNERRSLGVPKWSDKPPDSTHDGPEELLITDLLDHNLGNENRSWGGPSWSDKVADPEVKLPCWESGKISEKNSIVESRATERSSDFKQRHLDNANGTWGGPSCNDKPMELDVHKSLQRSSDNDSRSMVLKEPTGSEKYLTSQSINSTKDKACYPHSVNEDRGHNPDSKSCNPYEITIPTCKPSISQEVSGQPHPSINTNGLLPTPTFNLNERTQQQSLNPYHQTVHHQDEPIKRPDLVDPRLMLQHITSCTPMVQNVASREKVAQITNLSASLAQIFGNGQHLPQLYAALNPCPSGSIRSQSDSVEPPQVDASEPLIQPNETTQSQGQYDPISDSIDQTEVTAGARSPLKGIAPSITTADPNGIASSKSGNPEEKVNESTELKQPEKVADKKEEIMQMDADGDGDGDGWVDEEGKKNKDPKGLRMFKFALVEFVKEILKPTWKERKMSKEAHKTIVRKVVDKVTGTIQGAQIPQTQEKIDHYLSYSKTKLTKLVQAYVEKYSKT